MILAFLAALGAVVVALVLYPVFTETGGEVMSRDEAGDAYRELEETKARLYEAIKDLDFEKDAGKVSAEDYEAARNDYVSQVARVMKKMDALAPQEARQAKGKNAKTQKTRKTATSKKTAPGERLTCGSCGQLNPKNSKFCLACGKPFGPSCAACGQSLPPQSKFCNACGEKVAS